MQIEVGMDSVEISRIAKSLKNSRFLKRVYSAKEQELFGDNLQSLAANFAAKEAFSKALGTGVRHFSLCEVSVLRNQAGAPYLCLHGNAARLAGNTTFKLSLTHTRDVASAVVITISKENM